jgi:hypothetical protein
MSILRQTVQFKIKSTNSVILCVIHHCQNPLDSTALAIYNSYINNYQNYWKAHQWKCGRKFECCIMGHSLYSRNVMQYLVSLWPGWWIGWNEVAVRPLQSPNLTPTNFHLSGHLRSTVHAQKWISCVMSLKRQEAAYCHMQWAWSLSVVQEFLA